VTTLQTVVVERPPEGPARGKWEAPGWAVALLAVTAVLVALGYGVFRLLRARNPQS
jgi:hypothetical protein